MADFAIESTGAITSIGRSARETLRSLEADVSRCRISPYVSLGGTPFVVSPVLEVRPDLTGLERATRLLLPALDACMRGLTLRGPVACFIAIDRTVAGIGDHSPSISGATLKLQQQYRQIDSVVAEWLQARDIPYFAIAPVALGPQHLGVLARSFEWLEQRKCAHILWAGVSSACEPARLDGLDLFNALLPPAMRHPIVGGEAAAVVALGPHGGTGKRLRWAIEKTPVGAIPPDGSAASRALQRVVDADPLGHSVRLFHDAPDGPTATNEWTTAYIRNADALRRAPSPLRPPSNLGHLESAALPLYAALAAESEVDSAVVLSLPSAWFWCRTALRVDRT